MNDWLHFLLVEDDVVSVMGVRRAFEKLKIANPLSIARDGVEALAVLRGDQCREPLPRPFAILLDLNLPRMDGKALLAELKRDPDLSDSLVFVLTTSRESADRSAAAEHGVVAYLVKSDFIRDMEAIANLLEREVVDDRVFLKPPSGGGLARTWKVTW